MTEPAYDTTERGDLDTDLKYKPLESTDRFGTEDEKLVEFVNRYSVHNQLMQINSGNMEYAQMIASFSNLMYGDARLTNNDPLEVLESLKRTQEASRKSWEEYAIANAGEIAKFQYSLLGPGFLQTLVQGPIFEEKVEEGKRPNKTLEEIASAVEERDAIGSKQEEMEAYVSRKLEGRSAFERAHFEPMKGSLGKQYRAMHEQEAVKKMVEYGVEEFVADNMQRYAALTEKVGKKIQAAQEEGIRKEQAERGKETPSIPEINKIREETRDLVKDISKEYGPMLNKGAEFATGLLEGTAAIIQELEKQARQAEGQAA